MLQFRRNQCELVGQIIGPGICTKLESIVVDGEIQLNPPPVYHLVNFGAFDFSDAVFR